ncbi:MAG: hypothetical protein JJ892_08765 [Balneola sp.]|nr:hypothetical protein [Balneola sp.]MBO6650252.1 hypothetical protein [Balneola sp.]MBO6712162.1 hypothetical protein [Balneola sp.]MBO6800356.1 hypothetical protein [Balneola sp.]MBO6869630.1 hypothetical protein [Balneola sp.]
MPSFSTFSISADDIIILEIFSAQELQRPEGLSLVEIGNLIENHSEIEKKERGNLHRTLSKLKGNSLLEKTIYSKNSEVKYTINKRGKAFLKVQKLVKDFELGTKKLDENKDSIILKVEYWAGSTIVHTFNETEALLEHFKETKPIAFHKNSYRFYFQNGTHLIKTIGDIQSEDDLTNYKIKPNSKKNEK